MNRFRLGFVCVVFTVFAASMGCGRNPDATGEAGIGAAGTAPNTAALSEQEAYAEQLKQEAIQAKESRSRR